MNSNVSPDKATKEQRRKYYAKWRGSWDGVVPVTKIVKNGKLYSRKRVNRTNDDLPADRNDH